MTVRELYGQLAGEENRVRYVGRLPRTCACDEVPGHAGSVVQVDLYGKREVGVTVQFDCQKFGVVFHSNEGAVGGKYFLRGLTGEGSVGGF